MENSKPFRHLCFTAWAEPVDNSDKLYYLGWAKEEATTTKTEHWQGVAHSKKPMRITGWKKLLQVAMHCEEQQGTNDQAIAYFKNPERHNKQPYLQLYERGSPSSQGMRGKTGIQIPVQEIRSKMMVTPLYRMMEEAETVEEMIAIEKIGRYIKPVDVTRQVVWLWGPPGNGKTWMATHKYGENYYKYNGKLDPKEFFNGYQEQEIVIFDDLKPWSTNIQGLLTWLDHYPNIVNIKNGFCRWMATTVIVTSIYSPEQFWQKSYASREPSLQLTRRLNEIIEVPKWVPL